MIVSEVPGTTRDSVDVRFELDGLPFVAIDTAGVRRKAKIRDDLDFYSIHRAERSIRRADVVLLFIDPTQGITRLDKQLADYIAKQYKPCIFVINKWDLILSDLDRPGPGRDRPLRHLVQHAFRTMAYVADRLHHGQDRQERQGADQPGAVDVQAGQPAGRHRHAEPGPPRGGRGPPAAGPREPAAEDLLRHPGRRRAADDRPVRQHARASSTRPISATC